MGHSVHYRELPVKIKLRSVCIFITFPLVSNILFYHLDIDSDGGDKVSSTPETFLTYHFLLSKPIMYNDSTLSFEFSHDISNGVFWCNSCNHVNMIWSDVSFYNLEIESFGKFFEEFSYFFTNSLKKYVFSIFWYYHNVVCTIPLNMRLCFMVKSLHRLGGVMPLLFVPR